MKKIALELEPNSTTTARSQPAGSGMASVWRTLARMLWVFLFLGAFRAGAVPLIREANTSLKIPVVPGSFGYTLAPAFPGLTFSNPVAVLAPPGETNRLFVVERAGRIAVITNLASPTRTVFLDLTARVRLDNFNEMGLLGLAFHPDYARNGRFFVFYTATATTAGAANARHDRLSEFKVRPGTPAAAEPASESILIQQADDLVNHNGGDLHFGADGYLYVSLGDEGGANDTGRNSQRIDKDFFSGILRIDVDSRPGNLAPNPHPAVVGGYRVPADNPFVGATTFNGRSVTPASVRTEFWSVGLRNPWRMSFDRLTGELWVGDVGQDAKEGVVIATRGSNHGWSYREMDIAGPDSASAPVGFRTNAAFRYVAPVWSYSHGSGSTRGDSVIGGRVYRGNRFGELYGAYVFADYVSGNVWALRRGPAGVSVTRLLGSPTLSAFGEDPRNGDLLACDHGNSRVLRLQYTANFTGAPVPERLSETGAFADLSTLRPNPGIVPYALNTPFWSDEALKYRWFSVPDTTLQLGFNADDYFTTPTGSFWIKHFELELTNGVPESARRIETRFLVRNTNGIHGLTYRWTEDQTDALLVPEEGQDEPIARWVNGKEVVQTWRYPSRAECRTCHNPAAGWVLGFNAAQLNREFHFESGSANYLSALVGAGYFSNSVPNPSSLKRSAGVGETGASVGWRARSWLSANCSACHRPGGVGGGLFDARLATSTPLSGLIGGGLVSPSSDPADRLIVPGDLVHSEILDRMSKRGTGQMPPIATSVVDAQGTDIVSEWIRSLGIPIVPVPLQLQISMVPGGIRVSATQPAGRGLQLQSTGAPLGGVGDWGWVEVPGNDYFISQSSRLREWTVPYEATNARYFRVVVWEP